MPMIKGYPEGSDITIIDAVYTKPRKNDSTGEWEPDNIDIIYRDNKTRLKSHQVIKNPKIQFYVANDDVYIPDGVFPPYLKKDMVHPVVCKYSDLKKTLAEITGQSDLYYQNIKSGNNKENDKLHVNNRLYRTDMNIEDYYRYEFDKRYMNSVDVPLKKSYLDIEVDGSHMLGDFPTPQDSPINAVTFIDMDSEQSYTYLLRDPTNPLCKEFEESLKDPSTFKLIKDTIVEYLGGWKKAIRLGVYNINFNFLFFDEEIVLLYELFKNINTLQPDFLVAWNMAFDIPFIIDRIKVLGYNPLDLMRHPDFSDNNILFYFIDELHKNDHAESGDFARIPCYTIYLDQMKQFASRRKGQSAYKSNKLDDIAEAIAGIHKYDYHSICPDLMELPKIDYFIFTIYNIIDVIAQVCIENKTNDLDFVFNKCISMNTRYSKAHRQTIYLYNRAAKSYESYGFIIGNNINKYTPKDNRKYRGAYVADPELNDISLKRKIYDLPIEVYDNCNDFDEMLVA